MTRHFARSGLFGLTLGLAWGLAACTASTGDGGTAVTSPIGTLPEQLGAFQREGDVGFAVFGPTRYRLVGDAVSTLDNGRRYVFALEDTGQTIENVALRRLIAFRPVLHLIGTLSDDLADPGAVHLRTLSGQGFALHGDTVATYKEIRGNLPQQDTTQTLFRVSVVADAAPDTRYAWLDYDPVPLYTCVQSDTPEVHLDLVDVQPNATLLDGFIRTDTGGEPIFGPHAACTRDGAAYACALDRLGTPYATSRFVPGARLDGTFAMTLDRTGAAATIFDCRTTRRDELVKESER